MSSSLGPIHYWLYDKIKFAEEITGDIADTFPANGRSLTYKKELPSLESEIDIMNIHGWLQERIHDAEGRNAALVTGLLSDGVSLDDIERAAEKTGRRHAVKVADARAAYKALNDTFLNGMPCDNIVTITYQGDDEVRFMFEHEIHGEAWETVKGDVSSYYAIRRAAGNGLLSESGFVIDTDDNVNYAVRRV